MEVSCPDNGGVLKCNIKFKITPYVILNMILHFNECYHTNTCHPTLPTIFPSFSTCAIAAVGGAIVSGGSVVMDGGGET